MARSKPQLADPLTAAHVLARYRRMMRLLMMAMVCTVLIAGALVYKQRGAALVYAVIGMAVGIAFVMLLVSARMGLAFWSNRSFGPPATERESGQDDSDPGSARR